MKKPKSLRGKEVAADGSEVTPILIGVASGTKPRFLSIATYKDAKSGVTLRSNSYGGSLEVASPIDGTPLTQVEAEQDVAASSLYEATTLVGSCDHCSTDLLASKVVATALAGASGHCVMCGSSVDFTATDAAPPVAMSPVIETPMTEAASDCEDEESEEEESEESEDEESEEEEDSEDENGDEETAGDPGANRFAFDGITLVNEDDPDEEVATMATNEQTARERVAAALRSFTSTKIVLASDDEEDLPPMDDEEEEDGEDEEGEEEEIEEASADAPAAEVVAVATSEDDLLPDAAAPVTIELPNADVALASADVPIDNYLAVDINTVDLSAATMVPIEATDSIVALLDNAPAIRLDKEAASAGVQAIWHKPTSVRQALVAALATSDDRSVTLATFGGRVCEVATSMRGWAAQKLDAFTANAEREVATIRDNSAVTMRRALEVASLGIAKGVFGPSFADPVVASLIATLDRQGVRNPQALVLASIRESYPALMQLVLAKANELAVETETVLNTTAELVGSAPFPVELPAPAVEAPVITAAPAPTPTPQAPTVETASVIDLSARMQKLASGLGRR